MADRADIHDPYVAPLALALDEEATTDRAVAGGKGAALARARRLHLPVLPGFVLPVGTTADRRHLEAVRRAWEELSHGGTRPLAVRSSAVAEDAENTSMAGYFTSVLDVAGWDAFVAAVGTVLRSGGSDPMAVLVQPMLDAHVGGVLFGVDPVSGRQDRVLAEAVHGGPSTLVSGGVVARGHLLTLTGALVESTVGDGPLLDRRQRRALAELAARTAAVFGGPQDVEWAFDGDGHLWLLQSRPVTTSVTPAPEHGPIFGPGPVAETLPDPLSALEQDLWADPIRTGIAGAIATVGAVNRKVLRRSPVVVSVGGRLAADLGLLGIDVGPKRRFAWLDPRGPARRLAAAWRVGRLRRALPGLAADVLDAVDTQLRAVPALADLDDDLLVRLLRRSRDALHAVHGHEVLAGVLGVGDGVSGAASALAAVAVGRSAGRTDAEIVAATPAALALYPPRIGRRPDLPEVPRAIAAMAHGDLGPREALRLRARWLQEIGALAAAEAGRRLVERGALPDPLDVRHLRLAELTASLEGVTIPAELAERAAATEAPPLPPAFRLAADGSVHAVATVRTSARGAGGGRGVGPVHHAADGAPPPGSVLVTSTLDPALAGVLPGLSGLVAETGSALSHLAIVARELGVATVVGVPDAATRFPSGTIVIVDGETGEVVPLDGAA